MQSVVDCHRAKAANTAALEGLFANPAVHDESEATDEEYALMRATRDLVRAKRKPSFRLSHSPRKRSARSRHGMS